MVYKNPEELVYFLILFKIKGHSTFRAHLNANLEAFEANVKGAKVTEKKVFKVDRITGLIKQI